MRNFTFSVVFLTFTLGFLSQAASAENPIRKSEDGFDWLVKTSLAPRHYNFKGTFIYYADGYIETSRVVHKVDETGEHERIEVLDGKSRIVFRNNDEMKCYLPDNKKIYTEKRWFRKFFPDLLPQPSKRIYDSYDIEIGKIQRVVGYNSQLVKLLPKDNLRYGYRLWIEIESGLLLKVAVIDKDEIIEQFAFADVEIGQDIDTDVMDDGSVDFTDDWKTEELSTYVLAEGELNWHLGVLPEGFRKITEMRRSLMGKPMLVDHIVLSDELASVSVFIEPVDKKTASPMPGFYSSRGAINIYVRELEDKKITTVGEVPLNTIKLIGDAVNLHP